ncbi:MAG: endopeptidase La [Armatimonadota bacterium]
MADDRGAQQPADPPEGGPAEPSAPDGEQVEVPKAVPVLPARHHIIFPHMVAPLELRPGPESQLIDLALAGEKMIGVAAARDPEKETLAPEDLHQVGSAVLIHRMFRMPDGTRRCLVQGVQRIRITRYTQTHPFFIAEVEPLVEAVTDDEELDALKRSLLAIFQQVVEESPQLPEDLYVSALNVDEGSTLADLVAANLSLELADRQAILEELDVARRLRRVAQAASTELEILKIGSKIQSEAQDEMQKAQREYYLRQQLKAIQKELGEAEEGSEIEELRQRVEEANMPEAAHKAATRELERLSRMPTAAAEYTTARTYLEWLLDVPWQVSTDDRLDVEQAQKILDEDHYDLDKVKDRIVEYLAVRKLKEDMKGPILCFVGPPGVGKTSLGQSIARALGRKFVRMSLGGIRDEAEIRGHRRTYVGALPGRIVQGLRNAGTNNPVFMLDEIDKVGADFRGDPSAALLEVLDPEQNHAFSDHYLEVPLDLSQVMFITTANILDTVPPALRDRMEVLPLPGYTEQEKVLIAERFLIPRQLNEHGLKRKQLAIRRSALRTIIGGYTREAGVRNLERQIATICRRVAKEVAMGKDKPVRVSDKEVEDLLGPVQFFAEAALREGQTGVVAGLAYTPAGGEILFVEATGYPGKGELKLTGHLGEVMRESAEAGLSYVRARADHYGIDPSVFDKVNIHIHVPAGQVPKDGPSAGVAMVTAVVSLLSQRPARSDAAMTGEITLRGVVLPIGGVKEKCLAAHRAGIKDVILPAKNEKDLEDIPEELRDEIDYVFVETVDDVLAAALEPDRATRKKAATKRRRKRARKKSKARKKS